MSVRAVRAPEACKLYEHSEASQRLGAAKCPCNSRTFEGVLLSDGIGGNSGLVGYDRRLQVYPCTENFLDIDTVACVRLHAPGERGIKILKIVHISFGSPRCVVFSRLYSGYRAANMT